jgi:hypothetical protein
MKQYLLLRIFIAVIVLIISLPFISSAQKQATDFSKFINLSGGLSFNGTGDNIGPIVGFEYGSKKLNKNWFWSAGFGATIHSDTDIPLVFEYMGNTIDGTVRETNAGIQVFSHIGYSFINNSRHLFALKAGGFFRYQSNSVTSVVYTLFPLSTGLDFPVYVFENRSPQITFSAGLTSQFTYTYKLNSKLGLGIVGGFQFDSNGDNISQLSLSVTRFFK